jgi:hypothetical protein
MTLSEFADLDQFGPEARAEHAFAPDLSSVPNGVYDCQFHELEWAYAQAQHVLRCDLSIAGQRIRHTYWFGTQTAVNTFLAEMKALGLPVHTWGSQPGQTPLSAAIPAAVNTLHGVRFRATKTSRPDTRPEKKGVIYHDLHIGGRIKDAPAAAPVPAAPPAGNGHGAAPAVRDPLLMMGDPGDIPF